MVHGLLSLSQEVDHQSDYDDSITAMPIAFVILSKHIPEIRRTHRLIFPHTSM